MSWLRRNPLGPIRVPAGAAGDAFIDWLCKQWGTTREEALERGREAMRTTIRHGPIISMPMKAPVGSIFFMDNHGKVDEEALAAARENAEQSYTRTCVNATAGYFRNLLRLDVDPVRDEVVREVSLRHFYPTRQALAVAKVALEKLLEKHPEDRDWDMDAVLWAIDHVVEAADEDLKKRSQDRGLETIVKAAMDVAEDDREAKSEE